MLEKNKIIIWGIGQISETIEYYINRENAFNICGYTMDKKFIKKSKHNSKPLVPFEELEKYFPPNNYKLLITISYKNINKLREQKYLESKKRGYNCVSFISKQADCTNVTYGENVIILPHTIIQPYSKIGNNTIIWTGTIIGHHSSIGNNVFLSGCGICGNVKIGNNTFIASGATICDNITIGKKSIIGAGAMVSKKIKNNSVIICKSTPTLDISSKDAEELL